MEPIKITMTHLGKYVPYLFHNGEALEEHSNNWSALKDQFIDDGFYIVEEFMSSGNVIRYYTRLFRVLDKFLGKCFVEYRTIRHDDPGIPVMPSW